MFKKIIKEKPLIVQFYSCPDIFKILFRLKIIGSYNLKKQPGAFNYLRKNSVNF